MTNTDRPHPSSFIPHPFRLAVALALLASLAAVAWAASDARQSGG